MPATIRPYRPRLSPSVFPAALRRRERRWTDDRGVRLDAQLVELAQRYLADGAVQWEYLLVNADKRGAAAGTGGRTVAYSSTSTSRWASGSPPAAVNAVKARTRP